MIQSVAPFMGIAPIMSVVGIACSPQMNERLKKEIQKSAIPVLIDNRLTDKVEIYRDWKLWKSRCKEQQGYEEALKIKTESDL